MIFVPVKADFALPGWPVLTVLVCIVCLGIFLKQDSDWKDFNQAIDRYCQQEDRRSRIRQIVFERIQTMKQYRHCAEMMYTIATEQNGQEIIDEIVQGLDKLSGFKDRDDSRAYVRQMLEDELRMFETMVPDNPDHAFAYYTNSWNPLKMLTSSFAHGDWLHIIFNLFFFFAFAATVETLMGPVAFLASILVISLFTGVFSSVSAYASGVHYWTLGLSGVVMGMMGLYTYLLPRGKIRCYYWFIVIVGSIAVPAWALTLWFVGGDIWRLFTQDDHGFVNVMAHVTGGIAGYLFGFLFLRKARERAKDLQLELDLDGY
ncbi:MAG: rhomboid family intramembrane serine protease [Woeseiaceae bacterium]|nr:rhomboid family intramembrane serine protease [Woeseiaceae bacterium]